ncbi:MAG: DedA family protein [Proteobacteria bacterium]|nr:DedA family protein [Pseudomonadota bacterium]
MQEWLLAQSGAVIYLSLAFMLAGGALGLPIPEDIPLLLGGILIQIGKTDLTLTFLVCYVSVVAGDLFIFSIGRYFGPKIFKLRWFESRETKTRLKRIRLGLERRSVLMIFIARHLFYVRTLTFLSCGALRMRYSRFLVADALAALISVPLMLIIGYFAAGSFDQISKLLTEAKIASLVLLVLAVVGYLIFRKLRSKVEILETLDTEPSQLSDEDILEPLASISEEPDPSQGR